MKTQVINTEIKVLQKTTILGKEITVYGTLENPLFLAKDVAEWIEHSKPNELTNLVDEDEKLMAIVSLSGQKRQVWCVNEDGLYEILMQSRKPKAKEFKKAVKKILKELRTKGGYIVTKQNDTPEMIMARALQVAQQTIDNHEQQVKSLESRNYLLEEQNNKNVEVIKRQAPKVKYCNDVLESKGGINVQIIAKDYIKNGRALSAERLNKLLYSLGVQYKQGHQWLLYQKYANKEFAFSVPHYYTDKTGNPKTSYRTVWTEKGKQFIHELLIKQGYERVNS